MEALAVLRLTPPPGRSNNIYVAEPSPPSSPRHAFTMEEVEEAPLGEVRAAIPFLWELTPGTPKDDFEMQETGSERQEDDSDSLEFSFDGARPLSPPHELGHVVPLRLPPRLQQLQSSSCSSDGSSNSKMMLCGFMRTLEEEVTILGMQERKQRIRSLSPLRFLSAERNNLSTETSFSRDSVSSFSSSSSGNETSPQALWDSSPDGKRNKGRTLNDLVPDMVPTSRGEDLKASSAQDIMAKPRMVESGRELLKKLHPDAAEKMDVMPKLSPPPARSRPSSSPPAELPFRSSRREHLGRALFATRFGMLCSCLAIPPETP